MAKILRDNIQGITKNAITRLARRAGVQRISSLVYEEIRGITRVFLNRLLKSSLLRMEATKMNTLKVEHVEPSLKVSMYSKRMDEYKCSPTPKGKESIQDEIKRLGGSGCLLIPLIPFNRLVREVAQDYKTDVRFSEDAGLLLQYATENYIVDVLTGADTSARHAGRFTIFPKDLQLVRHLVGDRHEESVEVSRPAATVPKVDFSKYIKKVVATVGKGSFTDNALSQVNFIVNFLAATLAQNAKEFASLKNRETIGKEDVEMAVRTVFPGELAKHAVVEGKKSVDKSSKHVFSTTLTSNFLKQCVKLHTVMHKGKETVSKGGCNTRVGRSASIYLAAVLEYLTAEIADLSDKISKGGNVTARDLLLAIKGDDELSHLIEKRLSLTIVGGGNTPPTLRKGRMFVREPETETDD